MEKKDIFLCHSSKDKEWVRELGRRLELESIGQRNIRVFLDEWDIESGENLLWKINEGLQKSQMLAVIMSPEMLSSDWCGLEVSTFFVKDPLNRQKRIQPLFLRDAELETGKRIELPPVLAALNYIDFRNAPDFERMFAKLLSAVRGEPPPRGGTRQTSKGPARIDEAPWQPKKQERHEPDQTKEVLISNLLPVTPPDLVWTAPTFLTSKKDVHEFWKYPAFIVREKRIYSFVDLSSKECPLSDFITAGEIESLPLSHWRDKPAQWRWAIELLNDSLRRFLSKRGILFNPKTERYFFRGDGNRIRSVRWGTGDERFVAKPPTIGKGNWVHQAARLKFESLGDDLYLSIEPSWMFTVDGKNSVPREEVGPLVMQWGGKERNGTILRHILMWSDAITAGLRFTRIGEGSQAIRIERLPAKAETRMGLLGDHVAVGALLKFTEVELDLKADEAGSFEIFETEPPKQEAAEVEANG